MRSAAVINNGLRRYVAYSLNLFVEYWLQCRIVAGFFLMRFLIMYTLMYTVFRVLWPEAIVYILTIEVCNHVQACCPARVLLVKLL